MEKINQTIDVVVSFLQGGLAEPISFKYNDQNYNIISITSWRFDRYLPSQPHDRIYKVQTDHEGIAELRWKTWTGDWLLEKLELTI